MPKLQHRFAALCDDWRIVAALLLSTCILVIVLPIAVGGIHVLGDLYVYLDFAEAFHSSLISGDVLPSWMTDNHGFGNVGIRLYPPLAPFTLALIRFVVKGWFDAIWIYFFAWMLIGCWGVYIFVRDLASPVQGVLAGMLFGIIPFPLAEIYQFSLFAEFAAGAIIPYCFFFATRLTLRQRWFDAVCLAVSFSLLILTHIPTSIITTIGLSIYVMLMIKRQNFTSVVLKLAASACVALLTSAFYWIRVVTEINWVAHVREEYSIGFYGFQRWLFPNWIMAGYDVPSYFLPIFRNIDAIITLTVLALMPFFALLFRNRDRGSDALWRVLIALTGSGLFAFFMTTKASFFVWSQFTVLQRIQFPWRWLTLLTVIACISFVLSLFRIHREYPAYGTLIVFCAAALLTLMMAFDLRLSFANSRRISRSEFEQTIDIRNLGPGANSSAWWPLWANERAFETKEQVKAGDREVEITVWLPERRTFKVGSGPSARAHIATFYYPYWKASVNKNPVEVNKDENGAIIIPVDTVEECEVELVFEEPPVNKVAFWVSLFSWILAGALLTFGKVVRVRSIRLDVTGK